MIGINGWLIEPKKENEHINYWTDIFGDKLNISKDNDCYSLLFETESLLKVGKGLTKFIRKKAVSGTVSTGATIGIQQIAVASVGAVLSALAWPLAILAAADYIDNPWSVAFSKSKEAGLVLADVLANGNQGHRPVTLIGFSLGARVIFCALQELVNRIEKQKIMKSVQESNTHNNDINNNNNNNSNNKTKSKKDDNSNNIDMDLSGIIDSVILLGCPCTCDKKIWTKIRKIVSDRIINCYSNNDWVLKFVYRTASLDTTVAGLQEIEIDGIENVNLSDIIGGHSEYYDKTPIILKHFLPYMFF